MRAGQRVGDHRVIRCIGRGATGDVFVAEDAAGARVAIKVLHEEHAGHFDLVLRFANEDRVARAVTHPGLVQVYASGRLGDGRPYLVMELLDGTLADRLEACALPESEAVAVARAVAEALAALHEVGITHRDLKPSNIMFAPDGGVRVLDFGLAKLHAALPESWAVSTANDDVLGTPEYRAPEQWIESKRVDAKADVYSLGAILFEMLTGRRPFAAERENIMMELHLFHEAPAAAGASPEVAGLVARMLAKERAQRPTMAEVARALGG